MNVEIDADVLAEMLTFTACGIEESGEASPALLKKFHELVSELPEGTWNKEYLEDCDLDMYAVDEEDEPTEEEKARWDKVNEIIRKEGL
jgi:hypothetical protein